MNVPKPAYGSKNELKSTAFFCGAAAFGHGIGIAAGFTKKS